ncbi:hypothetical protein GG344DRAFT_73957 [Lentinula edodes]|nr:hypothetical protein GG344DRAFT_73957 [Lentinula edodes]
MSYEFKPPLQRFLVVLLLLASLVPSATPPLRGFISRMPMVTRDGKLPPFSAFFNLSSGG